MKKILLTLFLGALAASAQIVVNGDRISIGTVDMALATSFRPMTVNGAPSSTLCNSAQTITSSTNASPIVVTKASHGLASGAVVTVYGHTTNTSANGTWMVQNLTSSTFALCGYVDGAGTCRNPSTGNGVGGASGFFSTQVGRIVYRNDASAGSNLYYCTDSTGSPTWTQQTGGGGASITGGGFVKVVCGSGTGNGVDCSPSIDPAKVVLTNATATWGAGGTPDARGADHTLPHKTGLFSAIPGTCTVGESYFATDKTPPGYSCTATNTWTQGGGATGNLRTVGAHFDGGGSTLAGGQTACVYVPFSGTIQSVTLIADTTGGVTVDVKTVAYSSFSGSTSGSSIAASAIPNLTSASKYQDSTLTGWNKTVSTDTVFCFVLSSPSAISAADINLKIGVN